MANIWIVSDTHFGHANILNFIVHETDCRYFMKKLPKEFKPDCSCKHMRDFDNVDQMDDYMVTMWNGVVKDPDKVYHLGDVAMGKKNIATVKKCKGHKRLTRGNHDDEDDKHYRDAGFEAIYGTREISDMLFVHIPIHPGSLKESLTCVHGHVHNNVPALHFGPNYFNVSVEVMDYTPIALEDLRVRIRKQRAENQRLVDANLKRLGITPWNEGIEDLLP